MKEAICESNEITWNASTEFLSPKTESQSFANTMHKAAWKTFN